jgi:hypothetical protein
MRDLLVLDWNIVQIEDVEVRIPSAPPGSPRVATRFPTPQDSTPRQMAEPHPPDFVLDCTAPDGRPCPKPGSLKRCTRQHGASGNLCRINSATDANNFGSRSTERNKRPSASRTQESSSTMRRARFSASPTRVLAARSRPTPTSGKGTGGRRAHGLHATRVEEPTRVRRIDHPGAKASSDLGGGAADAASGANQDHGLPALDRRCDKAGSSCRRFCRRTAEELEASPGACTAEVRGSNPLRSTRKSARSWHDFLRHRIAGVSAACGGGSCRNRPAKPPYA